MNRRNSRSSKKAAQQRSRVKPEALAGGDIDYPGEFVLINRNTFSQIIGEAILAEKTNGVPEVPDALEEYPDLKSEAVQKIDFSTGPLMMGTAISPFPSAKQGPMSGDDAPPDFSLDAAEPEKKKKKQKKKKNKEKLKTVAKPAVEVVEPKKHEVVYDDQKEEEEVAPDFTKVQNEI